MKYLLAKHKKPTMNRFNNIHEPHSLHRLKDFWYQFEINEINESYINSIHIHERHSSHRLKDSLSRLENK
jgi:hypothetical protein